MTPDMKRLCQAAADECASVAFQHDGSPSIFPEDWEKVVCAVLTAMREPSGETDRYTAGEWSRRNVEAMVADILGEPATA